MENLAIYFIVFLKFLLPVLFVLFPFYAIWANYFLDTIDGDILQFLGMTDFTYQSVDKFADYFSYIFMVVIGLKWNVRTTLIILFVYRSIGQFLFFFTRNELSFVYFQNFLEPFLLIYTFLIFKKGSERKAFEIYSAHKILIWAIVIGYKLWNEWYLHYANIDLSTMFFGIDGSSLR